jgi:diguanylate cyclase (GGDEF)-like protein
MFDNTKQNDAQISELVGSICRLASSLEGRGKASEREAALHDTLKLAYKLEESLNQQNDRIGYLERLAMTDSMTGILNRRGFQAEMQRVLASARRFRETGVLAYIDLDEFKPINDTYGHACGDEVLCHVARLLERMTRGMDYVARLGGDEFAVLLVRTNWEAKDGSKLRFNSTTKQNGVVTDRYRGEARREGNKTVAIYAEPNGRRLDLPKDAFFPTAHQLEALKAAIDGQVVFNASYFDGSGEDAEFDVASVLTKYKGKLLTSVDGVDLPSKPVWNIQLAFFKPQSASSQPEMEIGARYRLDGISTHLTHDFGDFVLDGQLVDLELIPEPECN